MRLTPFAFAAFALATATVEAQTFVGAACQDSVGGFPQVDYPPSSWIKNPATMDSVLLRDALPSHNVVMFAGINGGSPTLLDLSIIGANGCLLNVANPFTTVPRTTDINGEASVTFNNLPFGPNFEFQWAMIDFGAPRALQITTTNGMITGVPPQTSAFRVTSIALRDPHVSTLITIIIPICTDITDIPVFGLNPLLNNALNLDADADTFLDLSFLMLFRPLDTGVAGGTLEFVAGNCTDPVATTQCTIDTAFLSARTDFGNGTNGCISVIGGTTSGYSPGISAPTNGNACFASTATDISLSILGIPLPLEDVQIGGEFTGGNPPTGIVNGLIKGFVPEAVADAIILPAESPVGAGQPLSSLLVGGSGNCSGGDDRDTHNSVVGWWVYLNYEAAAVPLQ